MVFNSKQKKQMWVSIGVMVLALITLVVCVVAWFINNNNAQVKELEPVVDRRVYELVKQPDLIDFPCATKILDTDITADIFNSRCAVVTEYVISGKGSVHTTVNCSESPGMIGYVWKGENSNYYEEIFDRLKKLGHTEAEIRAFSFEKLYDEIQELNDFSGGQDVVDEETGLTNTSVTVVYWVEYGEVGNDLQQDGYVLKNYQATLGFYASRTE